MITFEETVQTVLDLVRQIEALRRENESLKAQLKERDGKAKTS